MDNTPVLVPAPLLRELAHHVPPALAEQLTELLNTPHPDPLGFPHLDDHDWMELVVFDARAEWDGFDPAADQYWPRFRDPHLAAWLDGNRDRLRALHALHATELAAYWESPDADTRYHAHVRGTAC